MLHSLIDRSPVSHFSSNYSEARGKFLKASEEAGLSVDSRLNTIAASLENQEVHTDIVLLGPNSARKTLVLSSGTHGVEGYCGSGVQVGLLREGLERYLPEAVNILFVHAVNPLGFKLNRRVNELNVDLNRNFINFDENVPTSIGYAEVHPYLLPDQWHGAARDSAEQAIKHYIDKNGLAAYQASAMGGQYSHPDGVFYGGEAPSWSRQMISQVVDQYLSDAETVGWIDFHTGLGPYGVGELIAVGPETNAIKAASWYGDQVTSPDTGTSTSAPVSGTLGHGVNAMASNSEVVFVALEFGTYPIERVINAIRADNWLHQNGGPAATEWAKIKSEVKETFYPEREDWMRDIWRRSLEVVGLGLKGLHDPIETS